MSGRAGPSIAARRVAPAVWAPGWCCKFASGTERFGALVSGSGWRCRVRTLVSVRRGLKPRGRPSHWPRSSFRLLFMDACKRMRATPPTGRGRRQGCWESAPG